MLTHDLLSSHRIFCSWNVSGLGDQDKCADVRSEISRLNPHVVAIILESKLSGPSTAKIQSFLPPVLQTHSVIDSVGTAGEVVTAWNCSVFSLSSTFCTDHALSVDLLCIHDLSPHRVTNVYIYMRLLLEPQNLPSLVSWARRF